MHHLRWHWPKLLPGTASWSLIHGKPLSSVLSGFSSLYLRTASFSRLSSSELQLPVVGQVQHYEIIMMDCILNTSSEFNPFLIYEDTGSIQVKVLVSVLVLVSSGVKCYSKAAKAHIKYIPITVWTVSTPIILLKWLTKIISPFCSGWMIRTACLAVGHMTLALHICISIINMVHYTIPRLTGIQYCRLQSPITMYCPMSTWHVTMQPPVFGDFSPHL